MKERAKTRAAYDRLCQVIPGGVNSPVRSCKSVGHLPMVVERGDGDTLFDVDGHSYIDYCCSWGALIHGHAHPDILSAVQNRMSKGTSFGITTSIEGDLAQLIIDLVPSIKKIRFVSSGTEATMTAVRLARGFTKRDLIIKFNGNYHGHADFFLVQAGSGLFNLPTSSSAGIPEEVVRNTISLPYNDVDTLKKVFNDPALRNRVAAVILEPVAANMGVVPAEHEFIHYLREETEKAGALLIFDEVITGFRLGMQGAQGHYQVMPDITCLGKIIGGGFPAAALGGRQDVMDYLAPLGPVYQAGTLSGNPVAMEAGLQALRLLQRPQFYQELKRKSDILVQPVKEMISRRKLKACIQQVGSLFTLFFGREVVRHAEDAKQTDQDEYARFFRFMFERGVYIPPLQQEAWFISSAHTEANLSRTRDLMLQFFD